jgi:formate dehydrogenase major subunit
MKVTSASERARTAQRLVMELLLADQPPREAARHPESKLWQWADRMGMRESRFPGREMPQPDLSHPAMAVNLDACIHCNLCVRACREVQVNDVIGMAYRNIGAKVVFDMDDPMGQSTCVACGECFQACPTGALMPSSIMDERQVGHPEADREVDSVCPYCGVGCQITYNIKDDKVLFVDGRDGPANVVRSRLSRIYDEHCSSGSTRNDHGIRDSKYRRTIDQDDIRPLSQCVNDFLQARRGE